MTLNTLAELQQRQPRFDHRFTVEHYCISTVAQGRRLAALGGLASVNPYFVHYRSLIHADSGFGPDRAEATARLGTLAEAGVTFALHSDYNLVVGPMAPLIAAWVAVNRIAGDEETVMAPGERISVDRALRAVTVDAAFVLRRDHEIGSLEVGTEAKLETRWQPAHGNVDMTRIPGGFEIDQRGSAFPLALDTITGNLQRWVTHWNLEVRGRGK